MKKLLVSLSLCLLVSQAEAATYWVSPTGNNATCATIAASGPTTTVAKTTIAAGLACMSGGDTLNIRAGTYVEGLTTSQFTGKSGASYAAPTTVQAYLSETVTLRPTSGGSVVAFQSAGITVRYIVFKNLKFDAANIGTAGQVITIGGGGSGGTIEFLKFDTVEAMNPQSGTGGGNAVTIGGDDGVGTDIWFTGTVSAMSKVHGPACGSASSPSHLFYVQGARNIIEHTEIYNGYGYGIHNYGNPSAHDNIYRFNYIHDTGITTGCAVNPAAFGILLSVGGFNQAYGNILANNQGGFDVNSSSNVVYNNTLYANGVGLADPYQALRISGGDSNRVQNNLLVGNAINSIYTTGSTNTTNSFNVTTGTAASHFVNAAGGNFQLVTGSGAIDQGTNLGSTYSPDYASVARPTSGPWEVGAYEFAAAAPSPVVTITQPSGCTGTSTACTVTSPTVTIGGVSSVSSGTVSSDAYTCDRCTTTSGSAIGVPTSWILPTLTLKAGINIITVTATGSLGGTGSDTITITYAPTFPGNSLVLAFAFDEGSGTSLTDASGLSNTGTAIALPAWAGASGGRYGNALQFNGTDQWVTVADANSLDFTQSFTISLWAKPSASHTDFRALVHKNASPLNSPYNLYASITGSCGDGAVAGKSNVNGSSGPYDQACFVSPSLSPLPVGTWTHVAITWDGTNLKLYTQGVLRATTSHIGYAEPSTGTLQIGASELGQYFQGVIDELRIYNFALPLTGPLNTSFGSACNQAENLAVATASIIGNANCPITPLAPPVAFKIGSAAANLKIGSGSSLKVGGVPQ